MRYRTIVADPPWEYSGFPQGPTGGKGHTKVGLPYPSMSLGEMAHLPFLDLADPDGAWLFVWTTNRYLPHTFGLIAGWGFRYTQTITWRKTGCPFPRRGRVSRDGAFPSSVIDAPAQSRHSAKPEAFLDLIEATTPGPYLEMFARRQRLGWDTWGNEALNHVGVAA